jgi:hypothetical protein
MTTLICAGGSGTRVLEAVLHLCAAGLGPDKLRLLVIDPDAANGNGTRAKATLNKYSECRKTLRPEGKELGGLPFFRTSLDLLESEDQGEAGLKVWSPVGPNKRFSDVLNYALLQDTEKDVVHLFFTDDELRMRTDVGFRGHPSIGAATLSLLPLYRQQRPWNRLAEEIRIEVSETEGSKVIIVGSVFGGTGASAIHPLVRFLRRIPETNKERLKIGVVALVPYFQFKSTAFVSAETSQHAGATELAAKSEYFALATRAAVHFYQHLRENRDWEFDAMYWLGDDSPIEVSFHAGGPNQDNPAHFVDLLAGIACLDFFAGDLASEACRYAGPEECNEEGLKNKNLVRWQDVPLLNLGRERLETRLLQFALTAAVHLGFFEPLLSQDQVNRKPYCLPWYLDRFAMRRDWLTSPDSRSQLALLTEFFRKHHCPWWRQIHATEGDRVRLVNRYALRPNPSDGCDIDLYRLGNLLWPDRPAAATLDFMDRFFSDVVQVAKTAGGESGVAAYLTLLGAAAARFLQREYKKKES